MRGSPIHIVMPGSVANARQKLYARYGSKYEAQESPARQPERAMFLAHDGRELKRPAIQGYAAHFDKAFQHQGRIVFLKPEAFAGNWANANDRRLLFDHDQGRDYGGTADGLEFDRTIDGLVFRMPLAGAKGKAVYDTIKAGERACVSVGISILESEEKTVRGHKVEIISKATLKEISLVREPACPETFATIVDLDDEDPVLWAAAKSPSFGLQQAASNVAARVKRVTEALRRA